MGLYARWIDAWEYKLATRDTNRVVREFEWGLEWVSAEAANGDARARLRAFAEQALAHSDDFYACPPRRDFCLIDNHLTFTSAVSTPHPENNCVHADYFPARNHRGRAVVVLPQWNADARGHVGLCRLLNRFGISALRMSLAYHDRRMPAELRRADYHVSSNVGRTIQATRQSVVDARACLDWLAAEGYDRLGILGTSLGSCVGFIAAAHDQRLRAGVFNHVSMYFSDVVWTGLSTRHVRSGFETALTQDELRQYWAVISPASYLDRIAERKLRSLLIWGRYDTTFLPEYSRQVIEGFRRRGLDHRVVALPCGHYTTGQFPFNILDGLAMCAFLRRNL
jgi:hypothetical protein